MKEEKKYMSYRKGVCTHDPRLRAIQSTISYALNLIHHTFPNINRLLFAATGWEEIFFDISFLYEYSVNLYIFENSLNIHGLNGFSVRFVSERIVGRIRMTL